MYKFRHKHQIQPFRLCKGMTGRVFCVAGPVFKNLIRCNGVRDITRTVLSDDCQKIFDLTNLFTHLFPPGGSTKLAITGGDYKQ